jgi:hypothetical protein
VFSPTKEDLEPKPYPWAPTYKRTIGDIEAFVREYNNKKFHLHLSYEAQLQENWIGLDENNVNLREASMPNHQIMESLDLYTAERGVIRDKTNILLLPEILL